MRQDSGEEYVVVHMSSKSRYHFLQLVDDLIYHLQYLHKDIYAGNYSLTAPRLNRHGKKQIKQCNRVKEK